MEDENGISPKVYHEFLAAGWNDETSTKKKGADVYTASYWCKNQHEMNNLYYSSFSGAYLVMWSIFN